MDESLRIRMRMAATKTIPPRRSTEDDTASRGLKPISGAFPIDPWDPEDFTGVFGGPPRTVLSRQFSKYSSTSLFSDEVFRPPQKVVTMKGGGGRILSEFKIQSSSRGEDNHKDLRNGFYSDIFGCDGERELRSSARSKTSLYPVMSSKEMSPLFRKVSGGGDDVSLLAAKLRPINVKWNSTRMWHEDLQGQQNVTPFSGNQPIYNSENLYPFGSSRKIVSPETISLDPISNSSFRVSSDDLGLNSLSSADSEEDILRQDNFMEQEQDDDTASYVIEIKSDYREETCEPNGVDEAIAWAKEKFQTQGFETKCNQEKHAEETVKRYTRVDVDEMPPVKNEGHTEMQKLDEKIRVWSAYKEDDIRLLLSTLHTIIWPNSGWFEVPLMNLIQSSQVKKAYQKARLCLHPDKLQQREVTPPQKYIADKAFAVLQDAWAAFISQEDTVCRSRMGL